MFVELNDGRKVNMIWVISFYQDKNKVIFEMAKGNSVRVEEIFESDSEAEARVDELEKEFIV